MIILIYLSKKYLSNLCYRQNIFSFPKTNSATKVENNDRILDSTTFTNK